MESSSLSKINQLLNIADNNPEQFWWERRNLISWFKEPDLPKEGKAPLAKWYVNGTTNISFNAIDRHLNQGDKIAFYWINEFKESRRVTFSELFDMVNEASSFLRQLGVRKGERVSLLMPSVPEAVAFSLAVHRLGGVLVIHYIGLSDETLAFRLKDCESKIAIIYPKTYKNGREIDIQDYFEKVIQSHETPIEKVVIVPRKGNAEVRDKTEIVYERGEVRGNKVSPEEIEANEPSTIYYTSGTTGKPKGLYHSTAGYIISLNWAFSCLMGPKNDEIWWTISELGWPVWPMANLYVIPVMGLTGVLFEGYIGYEKDIFIKNVENFKVNLVWSSTTTLYTLKTLGDESVTGDATKLRIILNTGEPLNVGAWKWLKERLPRTTIADAYWMTEHLFPVAGTPFGLGEIPYKLGSAGIHFPGSRFMVLDDDGKEVKPGERGYIVIASDSPAFAKMWNDPDGERLKKTYWSRFPGYFYTGDYGYYDEDGYLYVLGRADDVILKDDLRIGTMEIENVLVSYPEIAEASAVGVNGKIFAFIVPRKRYEGMENTIKEHLRNSGYIINSIYVVNKLPKTKSGKIMRRLLRSIIAGEELGDFSTLDDIKIIDEIKETIKKSS
ncbi:AMP-binding protein [Acidianus sp. RZ1]|uniref:AMP-binding protein n=1 Tax=Acidianus sp. RZ1 TaxID=1540082 RepID=UPI001490F87F|nr:AMP-binding protein [Acidianus sp. RZ1]NON63566.1 AMP-binding protein [Acidianus sp. RZ1]